MQKESTNPDAVRAYRHTRKCVSVRFASHEYEKLVALRAFVTTKHGNSATAIITALIRNEPLTAKVDETAYGLLGKGVGMWKLAATTFPRPLKINGVLSAIELLRDKLIHRPTAPRTSNYIQRSPLTGPQRVTFYFRQEDYQALTEQAASAGVSRSAQVRALIIGKEITSRLSLNTANEIREAGLFIMAAINAEKQRQANGSIGESDGGILVLLNNYKRLLIKIKGEIE